MKVQAALACLALQSRVASGFVAPGAARGSTTRWANNNAIKTTSTAGRRGWTGPVMAVDSEDSYTVVVVRHGESTWNAQNRFTGWVDVPLSEKGEQEAEQCGKLIHDAGFTFDMAYTSVLKRAISTLWHVLEQTDLMWIPVVRSWRLNERHYGSLQGLDKKETVAKHGIDQVMVWRRSYTTPPPLMDQDSDMVPWLDRRYQQVPKENLPLAESLKLTKDRFLVEWENSIVPDIKAGKRVLIAAHGNTIRGLCQHLDDIPDEVITGLDIPTGVPLVYQLDKKTLKPIKHPDAIEPLSARYLGDVAGIRAKIEKVKNQTAAGAH